MTIIVFNKDNGNLVLSGDTDEMKVTGVDYVLINEIPSDKNLIGIDVNTKTPIYEDKPLSIEERLAQLEKSQEDQDEAIIELGEIITE